MSFVRGDAWVIEGCEMILSPPRKFLISTKPFQSTRIGRLRPYRGVWNVGATVPLGGPWRPHLRPLLFVRAPPGHPRRSKVRSHQKLSSRVERTKVRIGRSCFLSLLWSGCPQDIFGSLKSVWSSRLSYFCSFLTQFWSECDLLQTKLALTHFYHIFKQVQGGLSIFFHFSESRCTTH